MSAATAAEPQILRGAAIDLNKMPVNAAIQFLDRVDIGGDHEAFRYPRGERWESVSWHEVGEQVRDLAAGLLTLGLKPEQRVGIVSATRYEWIVADLAVMCAAGATTTVYPNTAPEDTAFILGDSDCRIAFVEDEHQLAKIRERRHELPQLATVVAFDPVIADGADVLSIDELAARGAVHRRHNPDIVDRTAKAIRADQLATLIYTSGTTGRPKGVRTLHRAWVFEGEAVRAQRMLDDTDLQYLWLPLSHAFGRALLSAQMTCGFATAVDGQVDKIIDNLAIVRPTFMGAAPRSYEKAYARVSTSVANESRIKQALFASAFGVGDLVAQRRRDGRAIPLHLSVAHRMFDTLVFAKIRARFGGRIRFFISGAAALNDDIAAWFDTAGLAILEGYGMTEDAAGATINRLDDYKLGTVGRPFPGTEVRIAPDGEVQIKGPHVMDGYHNLPDATAAATTADRWLRTGDKGEVVDGYLKITGRIKELFKTSGGKYIAPPAIEARFKALCPYASQFIVFGAERNFVTALITLDPDTISEWAQGAGLAASSYADIATSTQTLAMISRYVDELNAQLNRWETVKKWQILDHDLSVETGELTPSMKVKRSVVETRNQALIDGFYA
ncbi:long-chain fatty acid--CoA ligase [Amycolatopsis sp. K13G38]|uniref:Acyl-CoA synthetase n=1 Tax=Amycolatopsis acididurans TaxID=2724524 RepID=A0ABX1JGE3_9PSEU|nr:long-chain fatty acid--CoA ligase [Amycolatopsis acididurans]NKQ58746.1 long-chain fatty acid--CoA ligase [Amycolatopsis acididurans]